MFDSFRARVRSLFSFHQLIRNIFLVLLFSLSCLATLVAQNVKDSQTLEVDTPVAHTLKTGQTRNYAIKVSAGEYIRVEVEQRGIDVAVSLFSPDDKLIVKMDGKDGRMWREAVSAIAEKGTYRVEVKAYGTGDKIGNYTIELAERRPSSVKDRQRVEAERHFSAGRTLYEKGGASFGESVKEYEAALELWRQLGERYWEAVTLFNMGSPLVGLSKKTESIDAYTRAELIFQATNDRIGESKAAIELGKAYGELEQFDRSLEKYERALAIAREVKDPSAESDVLGSLGTVFFHMGQSEKAGEYFEQALTIAREIKDRLGEGMLLMNLGSVWGVLNRYDKARSYYEQALPINRELKDRSGEGETLLNLGNVYFDLGQAEKARVYYEQALAIKRESKDRLGEAMALGNLGEIYGLLGEIEGARDSFEKALVIVKDLKIRRVEAYALNSLGKVYRELGQSDKSQSYSEQALVIAREINDRRGEANVLNDLGKLYNQIGQTEKARGSFELAMVVRMELNDVRGEAESAGELMRLWKLQKVPRLAIFYGKHAVNAYQEIRDNLKSIEPEARQSFLKSVERTYRTLANLLISQERLAEAQQVLNSFKDQAYFDQLQQRDTIPLALTPRENDFVSHYAGIRRRSRALMSQLDESEQRFGEREPDKNDATHQKQLEADLKKATDDTLALLNQAQAEFAQPVSDKDKASAVADLEQLRTALRELSAHTGQKTVAVYQLVDEAQFSALVVTADSIASVSSPINSDELNNKARQLWGLFQSPDYDPRILASELYKVIFKPLEVKLPPDTKTIIWSLDGNLRYLPMAALYDGKQYLVERFNHVAFTRADKERMTREVSPVWTGYGFATSAAHTVNLLDRPIAFGPLDFVTDEMRIFRTKNYPDGIIDGEVFPEAQFTKASLLDSLKRSRPLVHISSHFRFQPGDESKSFLLLGDGQIMTLAEMKEHVKLFQDIELLTLSACDTAAQRPDATGREVDAFAELAQRLGAGSVMASLWAVEDRSTAQLMKSFYRYREGGKLSKAEALRRGQLDLLQGRRQENAIATNQENKVTRQRGSTDENIFLERKYRSPFKMDIKKPFSHPYYWSPFVLFGNWK